MGARFPACLRRGLLREWLVALCAYALLIAPVGCEFQNLLLSRTGDNGELNSASTGLFVNTGSGGALLAAGRTDGGDELFIYGDPDANGGAGRVDALRVVQADGADSYVVLESGWPVYARGPDGSYVTVSYEQNRNVLSATATVHDAGAGTDDTYDVTVDLGQTAQQVAAAVQAATGRVVEVPAAPAGAAAKVDQRALGTLLALALVATTVAVVIVVLGQVLLGIHTLVGAAVRATLIVIFWPIFLIGELLNELSGAVIEIEFLTFPQVFIDIPARPRIILD